ncbi:hypothetical protein Poly30_51140 [Planctomycetes bacterium Poly30]|uniref:MG2 domain protein n=1 Tax=Saltatorellus ferox TaxID=2528018 RepID=A0A518EZP0_9BACT|nr:hypothetical protein Poly30_51140 [Planctomycetes bacterium Poly30]
MRALRPACFALAALGLVPVPAWAQLNLPDAFSRLPAGFIEEFALAEDRGKTLETLLPGSVEHYYFSCLYLQQKGQLDRVDRLLEDWASAHGKHPDYLQIEARQALLRASTDPELTYAYLEKELGLRYDERRIVPGESPDLPTRLDNDRISTETLLGRVLERDTTNPFGDMDPTLLETLVRRPLSDRQRASLLNALQRPDVPGLLELVVSDLSMERTVPFGQRKIHRLLTLPQLESLRAARPEVLSNRDYVDAVMTRLAPRFPESMGDRADQLAYLERAWEFASLLPSAFVSLKAHLLYHWLVFDLDDLEGGMVDEERLMAYLRLPRASTLYLRTRQDGVHKAALGEAYGGITPFPAIGNEEAVVTECLLQVFRGASGYDRFAGLLEENYVRRVFAEAQLLHGDPAQSDVYIKMLGATRAEALRGRVDLQFARTNPRAFGANDPVTLQVDVKNVDRMIVKVFEIDAVAYFDRFGREVDSSLDLEGLVPNESQVLEFDAPPLRRVRRQISLDALAKPGTYVVELIGSGVSSRAVIVKGHLQLLVRPTAAGQLLRVLDEAGETQNGAIVRFGGRDYLADGDGEILVPYSPEGGPTDVLLRAGNVTSFARFSHSAESYRLKAAIHTPLEGLLAGMKATVVARPALLLNGQRIPLEALEDPGLVVTATTEDGTRSQSLARGFDFSEAGDIVHTIQVPERIDSLEVRLVGTVRGLTKGEDIELQSEPETFPVNQRHASVPFHSYLTRTPDGYGLELLGRAGEPLADTEVRLAFRNRLVRADAKVRLKTDASGRIELGPLADVSTVSLESPVHLSNQWNLGQVQALGLPDRLNGRAGQALRVPYSVGTSEISRSLASLLSLDAWGNPLRDHFDALSLKDGYLVIDGLGEGEYLLTLERFQRAIRVRVLEGEVTFGQVVGDGHALVATDPVPLQIKRVSKDADAIRVQLGGSSSSARVHVVATRYVEPRPAMAALGLDSTARTGISEFSAASSLYESGRAISDEYRYILDRRLLEHYPGNMLTRPGYLLNPWDLKSTSDVMAAGGSHGGRFGGRRNLRAAGGVGKQGRNRGGEAARGAAFHAPDFLAEGAVFLTDLRPDENGVVRVPVADLGNKCIVQIVAMDDEVTVDELLIRGEAPRVTRERRLVDALDPAKPMTQQRRITFLDAGESYVIRDAPNAGAKTFGSLADVFELYRTSGGGTEEFAKFEFLTRWPELTDEEKRTKYSEFACHELHVFLRERDPAFFESIVVPHLSSKGHATFMDDWLLGRDLSRYLEPWRRERLNVVEMILLLRETGGDAGTITLDMLRLLPPGTFSLDDSFAEILASRGLEAGGSALGDSLVKASTEARRSKSEALEKRYRGPGDTVTPGGGGGGGSSAPRAGPASPGPTVPSNGVVSSSDDFFLGRGEEDLRETVLADEVQGDEIKGGLAILEEFEVEDAMNDQKALSSRERVEGFYFRDLDVTREYAETHYWRVPLQRMNADLVTVSPFWVDFAEAEQGSSAFASTFFPLANRSVTEKLLALAFLDLPFEAEEPSVSSEARSVTLTAAAPMLLALEDIAPATPAEGASGLLAGQDFFDPARPTETVDGVTREVFVTGEFLAGVRYGCRMVVTNPSSRTVQAELLAQIPEGAIALGGTRMTKAYPLDLSSYGTFSMETFFYFPEPGSYRDYPLHVGRGETLFAAAEPATLEVVDEATEVDRTTWAWISQNAELPAVLDALRDRNPRELDLAKLAWRMGDPEAFVKVTALLGTRGVYPDVLWKYAVQHRDAARTRRFLGGQEPLVRRVGAPFESAFLSLDPRSRGIYEHLAYEPLVNGRTHEFGGERRILNDQFRAQYERFLATLVLDEEIDAEARMELVYYLLLQDRVAEALEVHASIDAAALRTSVQYDYMTAYMAFYSEDVPAARKVAQGYVDYPVDLWRSRFRHVLSQAEEIEGQGGGSRGADSDDRDMGQGALAGAEPMLGVEVDGGQVLVSVESIDELEVRYHRMDVEFLFSNSPFVRGGQGAFGVVRPMRIDRVPVQSGQSTLAIDLPDELRTANVVVEVRGAGVSRQATYFSGDLAVQGIERYGQIKVRGGASGEPLPKAYVKVYALLEDGGIRFHKDGYTDLRGRFDYVSLSGVSGPEVVRYALLVMHGEAGAKMLELGPPAR